MYLLVCIFPSRLQLQTETVVTIARSIPPLPTSSQTTNLDFTDNKIKFCPSDISINPSAASLHLPHGGHPSISRTRASCLPLPSPSSPLPFFFTHVPFLPFPPSPSPPLCTLLHPPSPSLPPALPPVRLRLPPHPFLPSHPRPAPSPSLPPLLPYSAAKAGSLPGDVTTVRLPTLPSMIVVGATLLPITASATTLNVVLPGGGTSLGV